MKELCEMMKDLRQDHDLTQKAIAVFHSNATQDMREDAVLSLPG